MKFTYTTTRGKAKGNRVERIVNIVDVAAGWIELKQLAPKQTTPATYVVYWGQPYVYTNNRGNNGTKQVNRPVIGEDWRLECESKSM
jgi:hypothetical protein